MPPWRRRLPEFDRGDPVCGTCALWSGLNPHSRAVVFHHRAVQSWRKCCARHAGDIRPALTRAAVVWKVREPAGSGTDARRANLRWRPMKRGRTSRCCCRFEGPVDLGALRRAPGERLARPRRRSRGWLGPPAQPQFRRARPPEGGVPSAAPLGRGRSPSGAWRGEA